MTNYLLRRFFWMISKLRFYAVNGQWWCAKMQAEMLYDVALRLGGEYCPAVHEISGALCDGNIRRFGKLVERLYHQVGRSDPDLAKTLETFRRNSFWEYNYRADGWKES
jgi:hypothetical protein